MASALERSLYPQAGLTPTAGTNYFGDTGRGTQVDYFKPKVPVVPGATAAAAAAPSSRPVNNVNPGFTTPAASEYETPGAGFVNTPTEAGFGSTPGMSPANAATLGQAATLGGIAAGVTGNQGLGMASGLLGVGAAASQGNAGPALGMVGSQVGGVPGAVIGGLTGQAMSPGGLTLGNVANTAVGLLGGPVSLANAASGLLGFGTIGDAVTNVQTAYGYDTNIGSQQTGMLAAQEKGMTGLTIGSQGNGVSENPTPNGTTVSGNIGDQSFSYTEATPSAPTSDPSQSYGGGDTTSASSADSTASDNSGVGGYADGGMIGERPGITKRYADGGPLLAMGFADGGRIAMGAVPSNASVNDRVNAILRNPQMRQAIVSRAQQLMDSGELTPEEVTTMGRVAEAAMFNPALYPQLRQFVAAQGMTPLPAAYDPSVVTKIIATARALQQSTPAGQVPPTTDAAVSPPAPGMRQGGMIHGPGTGRSDSIGTVNETTGEPVRVANGEYIIPEHVVRVKGREFFDNLLRRYADVPKEN